MKEEKIVVSHIEGQTWNQNKNQGTFRWKFMVDSTEIKSHGLSCGVLVLPPGKDPSSLSFTSGNPHYPLR